MHRLSYKAVSSLFRELSDICYCTFTQSNIISLLLLLPGEGGGGQIADLSSNQVEGVGEGARDRAYKVTCPFIYICQVLNDQLLPCVLVEAV